MMCCRITDVMIPKLQLDIPKLAIRVALFSTRTGSDLTHRESVVGV
jgi:hypothetical protein